MSSSLRGMTVFRRGGAGAGGLRYGRDVCRLSAASDPAESRSNAAQMIWPSGKDLFLPSGV